MNAIERTAAVDALRDLNFAANSFRDAVAAHYRTGIRETQAVAHLVMNGELSAGDLSVVLRLTAGSVTNLVDRLVRAGLATRASDPADLRRLVIRPTPRAEQLVAEVRDRLGTCLDAVPDPGAAIAAFRTTSAELNRQADPLRRSGSAAGLDQGPSAAVGGAPASPHP